MYSCTLPSTSALDRGGWSTPCPGRFTPRERLGTHCTGGWVGPRAGLDGCEKCRPLQASVSGPSSPQRFAIPTELSRPTIMIVINNMNSFGALYKISWLNYSRVAVETAVRCICGTIGQYGLPCLVRAIVGIIPNVSRFSSCFSQYLPSCQTTLTGNTIPSQATCSLYAVHIVCTLQNVEST